MFDFVSGAEELIPRKNIRCWFANVLFASAILAVLVLIIIYLLDDSSSFKTFFYLFLTFCVVLSIHYNEILDQMEKKYKNNVEDLMDTNIEATEEIIKAPVE